MCAFTSGAPMSNPQATAAAEGNAQQMREEVAQLLHKVHAAEDACKAQEALVVQR